MLRRLNPAPKSDLEVLWLAGQIEILVVIVFLVIVEVAEVGRESCSR